ncbi:hypothetical protein [Pseudarthrobacter chlorophenolicus]|uniref:COG4315 family predicted lipoprotein n=1 Tax=Pseudarthrobacter chlorophenolicus TaxID=85085 RepID=UPI0005F27EF8|nr:hypothetical protein [Pseudarthrobacter chlorophenolicus]
MKSRLGAGFAILALSAALAACGGNSGTPPASTPAGTASAPATPAASASQSATSTGTASPAVDLKTASSSAGTIVVDAKGMSVYFFTKDTKDSGTSACADACLKAWPPLTTTSTTPSADGVTGKLGTITTADGKQQVTLEGMPLYYFAKDAKPGDVLGQGVNNAWYLADPSGSMIQTASGAAY